MIALLSTIVAYDNGRGRTPPMSLVSQVATSASKRFPAPPGGANGGGISVSLLPFLPVDQNITLSLQSSALLYGTWSTPPQAAPRPPCESLFCKGPRRDVGRTAFSRVVTPVKREIQG